MQEKTYSVTQADTLLPFLLEQVKEAFDKNGIQMPYNHLNVHVVERKEEKG